MKNTYRIKSREHELYYHCVTRVVAGEPLFGDTEKWVFRSMMLKVADFCGIDILTYCVMSNHIHILCRVPPADLTEVSDSEILRRYRVLFENPSRYRPYHPNLLEHLLRTNAPQARTARQLLLNRMHDISMFMKILKLRMSIWFNKTHGRFGTLWAEKFKSIVVEGHGNPLLRMAQYIDLNPVRAGITNTSEQYPFCGIADAKSGTQSARKGIEQIAKLTTPTLESREAVAWYTHQLTETLLRRPKTAQAILRTKKTSPQNDLLRRQDRLSQSLAMGSRQFILLLMDLFTPAFSPRTLEKGPQSAAFWQEEEIFFGRKKRPHNP